MTAYEVRWRIEIDGISREDAASQAVAVMQERTGTITLDVRLARHGGEWEPVEAASVVSREN